MSTSPEARGRADDRRADDRIVGLISHWLARHVDDDELRRGIESVVTDELAPGQLEAVEELLAELDRTDGSPGELERVARETLEALALGA